MRLRYAIAAVAVVAIWSSNAKAADLLKPAAAPSQVIDAATSGFKTACYVEGSVGVGINTVDVSSEGASASVSGDGMIAGIGAGCDYKIGSGLFVGGLAGADWSNVSLRVSDGNDTAKVKSEPSFHLLAKVGFTPVDHLMVYGLAGASWSKLEAEGDSESFQGWMIGAGADFLLNENLTVGARYTADLIESKGDGDGGKFEPTNHVVRATLGWRF